MSEQSAQIPEDQQATNPPSPGATPWPSVPGFATGQHSVPQEVRPAPMGRGPVDGPAPGARPVPAPEPEHDGQQIMGVGEPAKLMRIGGMIKQLLDEVRSAPLDEQARARMADIHERSVHELETGLSPELAAELHRIRLPFGEGETPTTAELRVAQAQLVGWLEGVFHGLQAAMAAQQLANQQLAQRMALRQLPPGTQVAPGIIINEQGEPERMGPAGPRRAEGPEESGDKKHQEGNSGYGQYL
ncbi:proteasome activator [Paeniglutamicibacter sp. NPDC012692]|uniref:proteasome activator n=1 Tax=Paeniglutamicibacter sp. NPDC012692 TaxID=3364388 RepID=UPI00368F90D0